MIFDSIETTIDRIVKSKSIEKIICFVICLIVGMICAIDCYHVIDKVPATFDDYYPLNEKLVSVEGNPEALLDGDCEIVISNGTIKYTIENSQCEMTGTYDSQYNLINKKQTDKYLNFIAANFVSLLAFVFVAFCVYVILLIVIYIVFFIINLIIAIVRKYRKPKDKIDVNQVIDEDGNIVYSEYGKSDNTSDDIGDLEDDDSEDDSEKDDSEDDEVDDSSVDDEEAEGEVEAEDTSESVEKESYSEPEVFETAKSDESSEENKKD